MLRRRLAAESGSALVTALVVMALALILGITALATVDTQQRESGRERQRDSAFNTSEAALNAQIYQLSSRWPSCSAGASCTGYPSSCTPGSSNADCPTTASLQGTYAGSPDFDSTARWKTQVRDNDPTQPYYNDAQALTASTADANGDGYMWVRSTAVVKGHRRTLVALVKAEQTTQNFPHHTMVAGWFKTTNQGNKVIIDNQGSAGASYPSEVIVRCAAANSTPPINNCADYQSNKGQVTPERVFFDPTLPPAMSADALDSLRAQAQAEGNYYPTCSGASLQGKGGPGQVVFIEDAGTSCGFTANGVYNSPTKPGEVVIGKGNLYLGGTATFYGLIYHANTNNSTGSVVQLDGNVSIVGSIVVDGAGGIFAGSSKVNVQWDPNIFGNLKVFGTAGIVQNTFREISATS